MRLTQKRKILDCIETLKEARSKMKLAQCGAANELLEQCQEVAIAIGRQIEKVEKDNLVTISYLEEYCELLYKAFICENKDEYNQLVKDIGISLKKIERSIKMDIENSPHEIIFMPYKASMWDSMDSVYRAAQEDKNCHVVVMPVPYYNPNQKENQVEIHYEGNLFPKDISITDFRTYSIEQMHPEVIIIHNPYDQCNYVTQLPQEYFSSNLIKYTEHLVYIPYFITKGDWIKEDYCVMPAVKNAWRTFVQSEAVRKCYIKYGADPNRIVTMGSPKFDMVIKMQNNPPEIPEEWINVVEGRKVFLLNTHLNPLINEAEKVLNKLDRIFVLFKQYDNAVLLWRPHPLSIETLKSMNPGMLRKYLGIIEKFKSLDNVIYDDTSDIHRAIAISDAYIGDWSSLVTMYGITGKPIYNLNIKFEGNIFIEKKENIFCFSCGVIVHGTLWAPSETFNALCKVDLLTNKAEYVTSFMEEDRYAKGLYHKIVYFEEKLFLIPWIAKYIAIYHLKSEKIEYIIPDYEEEYGKPQFSEAIQYKNYLYLFPAKISKIVCVNMVNREINYFSDCVWELEQIIKNEYAIFGKGIIHNNKIWVVSRRINCLVEYCMEINSYVKHFIGHKKTAFVDITSDGKYFYILNADDEVIIWDCNKKESAVIWKSLNHTNITEFQRIIWLNESLWLIPGRGNKVIKVNTGRKNEVQEIQLSKEYDYLESGEAKILSYMIQDNKIIIFPANTKVILVINCITNMVEEKLITLSAVEYFKRDAKYQVYSLNNGKTNIYNYLYNENEFPLEYFINIVLSGKKTYIKERSEEFKKMQCNINKNCGEKIWQAIYQDLKII